MTRTDYRGLLAALHGAAVAATGGRAAVRDWLDRHPPADPVHALAMGKAAAAMMQGALDVVGDRIEKGLLVTKEGYGEPALPLEIRQVEAAHPVPDARSLAAGRAVVEFIDAAPAQARFLVLLSGGTSSLVEWPAAGVTAEDLAALNRWLLASGLDIHAMNRIRRACSRIKGGRLAVPLRGRAAQVLLISDVQGDDPADIGSGPLAATEEPAVSADELPPALRKLLYLVPPVPAPEAFRNVRNTIVASNAKALGAAAAAADAHGLPVHRHPEFIAGEAAAAGVAVARTLRDGPRGVHLWGGEPVVRLPERPGRGGRMQTLALSAARTLAEGCYLLAAGTDGADGPGDAAGAVVDACSRDRIAAAGWDVERGLARADAGTLLAASGDLLHTGPTGTNVMDLIIGLRL